MTIRRYSIKESLNRLYRLMRGETLTDDTPGAISGEIYSENELWSRLIQLWNAEIADESLTFPAFIGKTISNLDYVEFNLVYADGIQEGRLQWNLDDGTLDLGLPGGDVTMQIGQELPVRVINDEDVQMDNGSVVRITGGEGAFAKVKFADNSSFLGAIPTFGLATEDIPASQKGYMTTFGLVRDVATSDVPGTILWLGTTGTYTSTRPTAPTFQVALGGVIRQHATQGIIMVSIDRIPRLSFLSDVYTDNLQNGDILVWSSANARWENSPP